MSYLIKRAQKYRLQLCFLIVAILALVLGLPFLQFTEEVEAAGNPPISEEIMISGPDGEPYDEDEPNNVLLNMGDTNFLINVPEDGTITAEIDDNPVGVEVIDGQLIIVLPPGNGPFDIGIGWSNGTDPDRYWDFIVNLGPGSGTYSKSENGEAQDWQSLFDDFLSVIPSGCCSYSGDDCCDDLSGENGTSSPNDYTDEGGGDEEADTGSLHWELPFGLQPNEQDLGVGSLLLSLTHPGDNAAHIGNLLYTSVGTMQIIEEETTDLPSGVIYHCAIRQASGYVVWFEIKDGESIGYPRENTVNSTARIQMLDINGAPTGIVANAVSIRQYRGQGGIVTLDRTSGKATEYTTRQGRVTDFTNTDNLEIIYSDVENTKMKQIKTGAGLLTITENDERKYTVNVYAPGQFSKATGASEYSVNGGAIPRRTATVESPEIRPDRVIISVFHGTREYQYLYEYGSGLGSSTWFMARYVNSVLTVEKNKYVTYGASGRTTRKWVVDKGPNNIPGASGDGTVRSSTVTSPAVEYGGYRHNASNVTETSSMAAAQQVARSFEYYTNATQPRSYGKLKFHTLSDGREFRYEYDTDGRMNKRTSTWLDDNQGKVEDYSYTRLAASGLTPTTLDPGDYRPRTTTVSLDGNIHRKTFFESFTDAASGNEYVEISEIAATPSSSFGDPANFRTVRRYYGPNAGAAQQGRLKSVVRHNGSASQYTYAASSNDLSALTITTESSLDSSLSPVPAFSTRSITVKDSRGDLRTKTSGVYPRGGSGYIDHRLETCSYTSDGYKTEIKEEDLLTNRERILGTYTWSNGLLISKTDSSGVTYDYGFDEYDRLISTTRQAIPASGNFAAQPAITTSVDLPNSTLAYLSGNYAFNRKTTTVTAGSTVLTSFTEKDYRGRVSRVGDENGYITEYAINYTGTETTTTYPNGTTNTTANYLDGRHKSTTGTASVPSFSSYSTAANGEFTTTRYTAVDGGPRYRTSVSNMLGQNIRTERPALNGLAAATVTTTNHYQSGTGHLLRTSSDAANVPDYIMEYNSIGVLVRRGQSQDSTLTLASDDRITDIETGVESSGSDLWSVQRTTTYPDASSATPKLLGSSRSQIAGFSGDLVSRSESTDINGNLSYSETELQLAGNGTPQGVTTSTGRSASSTDLAVTQAYYGRTETVQTPGVTGLTTYTYDDLGRVIHMKDPRHTGDSDTVYFNNSNLVDYTENAKGEQTSYTYHANGVLGAGRVSTTTLPDNTVINTTYDEHGLTQSTWGSQTYTRYYGYNDYDEMIALITWQTDPNGDFSNQSLASGSITRWFYDAATGHLKFKRYEDNKGADYEYDTAGRLAKRTWARGTITNYTYTQWGELDTVTYPADPTGTRPVNYDYDRIGRPSLVTQTGTAATPGTNTHGFTYNSGNLLIDAETITYGNSGITRTMDHIQDTFLRPFTHELKDGATTEHLVDLAYSPTNGRLATVTDNTPGNNGGAKTFTYNYQAANYHLIHTVSGPVHTVTNTYEPNRNVLTNKENATPSVVSQYTYTVNNIGQRTKVTRSGTAMSAANAISWQYNERGELKEEDYGDNQTNDARDGAFNYDAIGNRQESINGTLTLTGNNNYTANALNQYASFPSLPAVPLYDDDGNMTSGPLPIDPATGATLIWDAENRLVQTTDANGNVTHYEYDYVGRRIGKTTVPSGGSTSTLTFIYEGWNLCAEYTGTTLEKTYTWGMDLSGTMQGAGGVGGLLAVTDHGSQIPEHFYPTYDGNGNVSEYLDATGVTVAHYEYDAFGNEIVAATSGSLAQNFVHRFSTKYLDNETGLYYYGYRYYDPNVGRWLNRDPIEEAGGINIYGFVGNDGINWVDYLGFVSCEDGEKRLMRQAGWYISISTIEDEEAISTAFAASAAVLGASAIPGAIPANSNWIQSSLDDLDTAADIILAGTGATPGLPDEAEGVATIVKWRKYLSDITDLANQHLKAPINIIIEWEECDESFFYFCPDTWETKRYTYTSIKKYKRGRITEAQLNREIRKAYAEAKKL